MSMRKALPSKTIDLADEVCGLVKTFGIRLPKTVKHGSFDGVVRPMIEMNEVPAHVMLPPTLCRCEPWAGPGSRHGVCV